jgi:hypothetical protein
MANVIRVENLSSADQELAPDTGFIPAHGFRDYPSDEYRDKHEKYAKARLEADPPVLKIGEAPSDATAGMTSATGETLPEGGAPPPAEKTEAQKQTEQNAEDAKKAEEQKRIEELKARQAELSASGEQKPAEDTRRRR